MQARFVTDTAVVNVNSEQIDTSVDVRSEQQTASITATSSYSVKNHKDLSGRDLDDQHPISAITGLEDALADKQGTLTAGVGIDITDNVISNTQTSGEWGNITGDIDDQLDLQQELSGLAGQISDNHDTIVEMAQTLNSYGDIVTHNTSEFATSTQGGKADTALQPNDNITELNNNAGFITGITSTDVTNALGYTPYNSSNPRGYTSNVGTVTSVNNTSPDANGNVSITLPDAQIQSDWNQSDDTAVDYIKNKPTIPSGVVVDQVYDATSENAQSGVAINGAGFITGINSTDVTTALGYTPYDSSNPDGFITSAALPTVNNATLTIQKNSTDVGTFTANASSNATINITVPTSASDVSALPSSTKYGANLSLSINSSTYVVTAQLKDQDGNNLGSAQTIDLPLESVVVSGSYDDNTKKVILTLQNGSTIEFSIADLVAGLQTEITSSNMLDADLVDDSTSTNKFVTASEKSSISTALQPNDNISELTNNSGYITSADLPTVNNATLTIQKNGTTVKTFTANASSNVTANITVPTDTNDLTNGAGYITDVNWGDITGTLSDQTDLQNTLDEKQNELTAGTDLEIVTVASTTQTVSGTDSITLTNAHVNELNSVTVAGKCTQSGTPSNTNPVNITCNNGVLSGNSNGNIIVTGTTETIEDELGNTATAEMLLSFNSYADTQELLTGIVTRQLKAIVLTGQETFTSAKNGNIYRYTCSLPVNAKEDGSSRRGSIYSTHFTSIHSSITQTLGGAFTYQGSKVYMIPLDQTLNTVDKFTTWVANQYTNGTPIIIIYPVASDIEETVAGQTLNVQEGNNTISITQASLTDLNITANYDTQETNTINFTNASGYTTNTGTVTSVNNTSPDGNGNVSISIPAAQVNSDWNANSGVAEILNKPTLATVATSGSYNDLTNKPTIPSQLTMTYTALTETLTWS